MDEIPDLTFDPKAPTKTYSELLAEGVPHKGGLAQLASAEKTGGLWSSAGEARPLRGPPRRGWSREGA